MADIITVALFFFFIIILYVFLNRNSDYWKKQKVPFKRPLPFFGNIKPLLFMEKSVGDFTGELYNAVEGIGKRFFGFYLLFNEPALIVRDPELIKNILVKDFQNFTNRSVYCDEKSDPLGNKNLFSLKGAEWKFVRTKLSPAFTSGKIKQMFELVKEVAVELSDAINKSLENENGKSTSVLESKGLIARFTTDVISICGFGIKSNCLKDEKAQFSHFGSKFFHMSFTRALAVRACFFMHQLVKIFDMTLLQKQSTLYFRNVFREAIIERENRKIFRNDFLDSLMTIRSEQQKKLEDKTADNESEVYKFEGDLLVAQPIVFFVAGFETTSTVISMTLYELALQPYLQENLRSEILNTLKASNGEIKYNEMMEMTYLDMVVSESLRKYPSMPIIERTCTADYKIPDSNVVVKKGTFIYIPLYRGLHYDSEYYPQPENYDPERFTEENKKKRPQFSYIPFGDGPRICIGMRFGIMVIKTALMHILSQYKLQICDETDVPLELDNRAFLIGTKKGVYLKFVKL